jgi:hypothetical protein
MESEKAPVYTDRIPTSVLSYPFNNLLQTGENMTSFLTVAVVTALCLLLPATRIYGVIGVGILLYFRPALTLGALLIAGIAYYSYRRNIT